VAKHSEDPESRSRGGDLGYFDRRTTRYPRALVDAVFALDKPGALSAPVRTERGFHILRLEQRRPGFARALADVKDQIRRQLLTTVRTRKVEELLARARTQHRVEVFEDRLPGPASADRPKK
jgi:peptidyl-prolyl cis-trans isomerase C